MSRVRYTISWNTRDRNLIHKVCRFLHIQPYLSVNRTTSAGYLTQEQLQALQPLVQNGSIRLYQYD